jgi:excisionase family DNA binding protein
MQKLNEALKTSVAHLPTNNKLMPTAEAADYLKMARSTLAKARLHGTGPRFIKIGRAVRYRRADLDAWINARYADSTADAGNRLPRRLADRASVH